MEEEIVIKFSQEGLVLLNYCLAFIMFGIALDVKPQHFKSVFNTPKKLLVGLVSQWILLPIITLALVWIIKPSFGIAAGMILVAASPGGNVSNYFVHLGKGNVPLSITLTSISTLCAVFVMPLNFWLYGNLSPYNFGEKFNLSFNDLLLTLVNLILIPLIFGMFLNFKFPQSVLKVKRGISVLSMIIFIGFVVIAFASNFDAFLMHISKIIAIVTIHNGLAYLGGFLFASIFLKSAADRKTISLETGLQNTGLSLLVIFTFFNGDGGMALVAAWWGIWHLISGFTLSKFWKTY
jgi:BASS family bile acid:Na+ symporter